MKKKIIIIGGGITGCMAALYIDKKKFDVSIYESKNNLGGVLSDFLHNEDSFLNGVQYLDVNTKWYSEIKKFFKGKLNEFSHNYGSITESENSMLFTNKFAVPAFTNVDLNSVQQTDLSLRPNLNWSQAEDSDQEYQLAMALDVGHATQIPHWTHRIDP
mgnify:CR=1 FL=1